MDPLWAFFAEVWWIVPLTVGAGTLGWFGLRGQRTAAARRLELDAAKHDVRAAREAVTRGQADLAVAHAELVRAQADRSIRHGSDRDVAAARRTLQNARQTAKSAAAGLRARQASLRAARATVPHVGADPSDYPLAKVLRAHNAVLVRWMEYDTDPAKAIAYPAMSDGTAPVMAEFLHEQSQAQWLRPSSADARMAPADFAAYRDAVRRVERSFDAAEDQVLGRTSNRAPFTGTWVDTAQDLLANAQRAVAWSAEAIARVSDGAGSASWRFPQRGTADDDPPPPPPPPPASGTGKHPR
ncbi:hypothetical protein ASD65_12275 [Microbacterium sp. Root61]|uniref:hypothetical protein n=1 Tax=Microbacterium sp. Root61 TaxID=1736570 RepID=UPI000702163B|nr:hypothetical protein [Microbacterium sp. Root61]KRA25113.1 hypothetical protein ASD65_12275 [Microbacterium sp. Root61]